MLEKNIISGQFIKIYKNADNIKICLCTLGKLENRYAREFVEHYKRYGVDKIFIYDNNEIKGEKFDLVLADYIILFKIIIFY